MTRDEIERITIETLTTMLGQEISPETSRDTLAAWDSLKHIQLVFALEDRFNVEFTEEQIPRLNSVRSIADHLYGAKNSADRG